MAKSSRRRAVAEAAVNTLVNMIVTPAVWYLYLVPVLHIDLPPDADAFVVLTFIFISFIRVYSVRRSFNWWKHR